MSDVKQTCATCKLKFPTTDFHKQYKAHCKPCAGVLRRKWYDKRKKMCRESIDSDELKKCSKCEKNREMKFFNERTGTRCIDCHNMIRREKAREKNGPFKTYRTIKLSNGVKQDVKPLVKCEENFKKCVTCLATKSISEYYATNANRCRDCTKLYEKIVRENKKKEHETLAKQASSSTVQVNKKCTKCESEKTIDQFHKGQNKCIMCQREEWRKYRSSEKGKANAKKWVEENKDRMKELQAQHYQRTKDTKNANFNKRMSTDFEYKVKKICQRRLLNALNSKSKKRLII